MNREELLKSNEYWTGEIQFELYKLIDEYMKKNNISRKELAEKLGVTKGYVSQILNGEFDHRISKYVELAMITGKIPRVKFYDFDQILYLDILGKLHDEDSVSINIQLNIPPDAGIRTIETETNSHELKYDVKSNYQEIEKIHYETSNKEEFC